MALEEETAGWVARSKEDNKQLFSELDVLLRALDRFFDPENLMTTHDDLTTKNFNEELITVRDSIFRVLGILEVVIPESRKNAYWFQKFAETKLLTARRRDDLRENLYRQDTPEQGLHLLYDSFNNLKGVISDLIRTGAISYLGFMNVGHLVTKEIRENVFFNPFRKGLNPEFDFISNPRISVIVKAIARKEVRKYLSVVYIYIFRMLRFLSFVDLETQRSVSLNSSLIILILLKSEMAAFQSYIEKAFVKVNDADLESLLKSIAYQFSMENRRVFIQELRDIHRKKASPHFRGKIENCHGILKNLAEQSVVQLAQFFSPEVSGEEIFSSFQTKRQQSIRLREDISVLQKFLRLLERNAGNPQERLRVFESLRNYMVYFESFTFRLLRHDDYEEFVGFFNDVYSVKTDVIAGTGFTKVMEKMMHFKIFLETTLRHIEHRSELGEKSLDMKRVEDLVRQYL